MSRLKDAVIAAGVLILGRRRSSERAPAAGQARILPAAPRDPQAELAVVALLALAACAALGFIAAYALPARPPSTQLLGLGIGLAFVFVAAALAVISKRLVVDEELAEDYPPDEHPVTDNQVEQLLHESTEGFTRRRLVTVAASGAGAAVGGALLVPLLSLGPVFDLASFVATPWHRGRRLVDADGRPLRAEEIEPANFYSAYPQGADREQLGAPLVVVRLPPAELRLPAGRSGWAPRGIVAYSKICTHAGCAISLYRKPLFPAAEPRPALVCPCHYSTFDPASGGTVLFGPAGRPLPQLPIAIGPGGELIAAGSFSGPVGPSWWGSRSRRPT